MKYTLKTAILAAIFFFAPAVLYADSAATEHIEKEQEKPRQKRGRPGHSLDVSYAGFNGSFKSYYEAKAVLDDKLFTIGSSLPVYNTLRCDIIAPQSPALPKRLYAVSNSVMAQSQEHIAFIMVSSSSDRPFHSMNEVSIMGVGGIQLYKTGGHGLLAAVYASNSRIFKYNVPIPCIYYTYKDDTLSMLIGIPSLVFWKINPKLWYSFSFFPFLNIETSLKYRPLPFMSIGPECAFKQDKYLPAGRPDKESKIYRQYATVQLTFQSYITMFSGVYLSAGYIPYNRYFQGTSMSDGHTLIRADNEFIFKAGLQLFIF